MSLYTINPEANDTEIEEFLAFMREPLTGADFDAKIDELNIGHIMKRDGCTREEAEAELGRIHEMSDAY